MSKTSEISSRRITLKDVAAHAGIGYPSVSAVLNGSKGQHVAMETRERILRAAEELGYRRNASASVLRSGRFGNVGLLLSATYPHRSFLPQSWWHGAYEQLNEKNYHLTISALPDETLSDETALPKTLREAMVDGLLINYIDSFPVIAEKLIQQYQVPVVWLNVDREFDTVRPDDEHAGELLTRHLIENGHRHIVYRSIASMHYSDAARQKGYEKAMLSAGLAPHVVTAYVEPGSKGWSEQLSAWKNQADAPTAIVEYNDEVAFDTLIQLLQGGWEIPREMSLVTFSTHFHMFDKLPLTTIVLPQQEIGQKAAQLIMNKIENPVSPLKAISLQGRLEIGKTVAFQSNSRR
jgi:LacI family transcriptional regulator